MTQENNRQEWIKNSRCFWCGKKAKFQFWQFYNPGKKTKNKHDFCWWCSNSCLNKAEGSDTKISWSNYGKLHVHNRNDDCFGEFSNDGHKGTHSFEWEQSKLEKEMKAKKTAEKIKEEIDDFLNEWSLVKQEVEENKGKLYWEAYRQGVIEVKDKIFGRKIA